MPDGGSGAGGPRSGGPEKAPPTDAAADDLRPVPVLVLGFVGDAIGQAGPDGLEAAAASLFASLAAEGRRIVEAEAGLFAPGALRLRLVTRASGPVDEAVARAAQATGAEIRAVRRPAEAGGSPLAVVAGDGPLVLGREPRDAPARVGSGLLDRSDILVARWDGQAGPRGSPAAIVGEAVERRIPVLLLPDRPGEPVLLIDDPDELLLPAVATDLPRIPLAANLDRVLARVFAPPAGAAERQALRDAIAEPRDPRSDRPEYRILLLLAARSRPDPAASSEAADHAGALALAARVSPDAVAAVRRAAGFRDRMETLAAFYGRRVRSGVVLRFGLPAVGSLLIALFAILAPTLRLSWLGVQALVTTLLIVEASCAARGRWDERWLDYRSLAERLRCDRFLEPLGIGADRLDAATSAEDPPWMRWCHRRHRRAHWVGGEVTGPVVAAALDHLVAVEIAGQIRYHAAAAVRFRSLAGRLRAIGIGSIVCVLAATAILVLLPEEDGRGIGTLRALLTLGLITLPSVFLAARGLKAEGAFSVAAARSEGAELALRRLLRRIEAAPPEADRLAEAARAAAAAMILDTIDWRVGLQRSRAPYRTAAAPEVAPRTPPGVP